MWPTFDDFWEAYDKKRDRTPAEKKWGSLSQKEKEAIMSHIPKYKIAQPDKQYRKDPETFLNRRAWENEIIESNGGVSKDAKRTETFAGFGHRGY